MNSYVSVEDKEEETCDEVVNLVFSASNVSESSAESDREGSGDSVPVGACSDSENVNLSSSYENLVNLSSDNFLMCLSQTLENVPILTTGEFAENRSSCNTALLDSGKAEIPYTRHSCRTLSSKGERHNARNRNSVVSDFAPIVGPINQHFEKENSGNVIQLDCSFRSLLMNPSESDYAANYCINVDDLGLDFDFGINQTFDSDLESVDSFDGFSEASGSSFEGFRDETSENLSVKDNLGLKKLKGATCFRRRSKYLAKESSLSQLRPHPFDLESSAASSVPASIGTRNKSSFSQSNVSTSNSRPRGRPRATSTPAVLNNKSSSDFKVQTPFKSRQNCAQSSSCSLHYSSAKKPEKKVNGFFTRKYEQESEKEKLRRKSTDEAINTNAKLCSSNMGFNIEKENSLNYLNNVKDPLGFNQTKAENRSNLSTCSDDSFEGFLDTDFSFSTSLKKETANIKLFKDSSNAFVKYKASDKSLSDKGRIANAKVDKSVEHIGNYCSVVGCTVSWLESGLPMTDPVPVNNGIVYELSEFAKKIAWEPGYVAKWILRLRGYSNVEISETDLKKIHLVLKRRKAISVNFAGCNSLHKNKLASFDLGEFSLPSVEKNDNETLNNISWKEGTFDNESGITSPNNEGVFKKDHVQQDNPYTSNEASLQNNFKKSLQIGDGNTKLSNIASSQNSKKFLFESDISTSAAVGAGSQIASSSSIGISSKGRVRKPTAKFQESFSLKYLLNNTSGIDPNGEDNLHLNLNHDYQQSETSSRTPSERFCDKLGVSVDQSTYNESFTNNLIMHPSDSNLFTAKVLHPVFEDNNNEIGKHCKLGKIDVKLLNSYDKASSPITNGIVYELYHFFRERKASLTSLVHTLYRLNGVTIDKSHIITTMAKIHEMVKVVWEEQIKLYPYMPYVKFDMPESMPESGMRTKSDMDLLPDQPKNSHLSPQEKRNKRTPSNDFEHQTKKCKLDSRVIDKNVNDGIVKASKSLRKEGHKNVTKLQSQDNSFSNEKSSKINEDSKCLKSPENSQLNPCVNTIEMPTNDSSLEKRSFDLHSTKGCEGKITRGDIVYLYTRWLRKKMECQGDVFVTDLSKDVEDLICERKVGSLRIPVGTLMSSSVKLFEEFRKLSKVNMLDAKTYLLDDWMEDIKYIVSSQSRRNTVDSANDDNSHRSLDSNSPCSFDENVYFDNHAESNIFTPDSLPKKVENLTRLRKSIRNPLETIANKSLLTMEKCKNSKLPLDSKDHDCPSSCQTHDKCAAEPTSLSTKNMKDENLSTEHKSLSSKQKMTGDNCIEECDIEKIVGYRLVKMDDNSATEYRVRWRGSSFEEDSWVSESDLNCPIILHDFWEALKKQRALKQKPKEEPKSKNLAAEKNLVPHSELKGRENVSPFFGRDSGTSPKFFALMIKNLKPSLVNYQYGEEGSFPRKGKVSKGEVLAIYDDWRYRNQEQLLAGGNQAVDINVLITRIKKLMEEKRVRNFNPGCLIDVCYRMSLMKAKLGDKDKIDEYLAGDFMEVMENSQKHQDFIRTENAIKLKEMNKAVSISSNENFDDVEFKINMLHNLEKETLLITKYIRDNKTNVNFEKDLERDIISMKNQLRIEELPSDVNPDKNVETLKKVQPSIIKEIEACGVDEDTLNELINIALKSTL